MTTPQRADAKAEYGEPWHIESGATGPYVCGRAPHGRSNGEGLFECREQGVGIRKLDTTVGTLIRRVIQCVNACAGIADPSSHIRTLEAENARLTRWMQPKITLSIGLDYHDCEIVDVGHSEIQLMVRCPDLEAENARLTAALADAKAEGERMRGIVDRLEWSGEVPIDDDRSLPICPACRTIKNPEGHDPACWLAAALASGGQAGKGNQEGRQ